MKIITRRSELIELAAELGVAYDWHEPDNQGLSARIEGVSFDNAGFWPACPGYESRAVEQHVILSFTPDHDDYCDGSETCGCERPTVDVAAINLATLLAWASGSQTV